MAQELRGTKTPWSYFFVRLLFKFVLKTFYGTIVIENDHLVPKNGIPCIVCANHSNSLTDALVLVTSVPSQRRGMLRLTAKSTQFGHPTFTSWLIESAGTVPIKRRRDYKDGENVDNTETMGKLMDVLELGDAVCLFPEGASRYHPTMQSFKTGVARILSDVLTRNKDNPSFQIALQTCSVTYMHPQHFRSDVLVTFHPPMIFTPKDNPELIAPVDFNNVKALTFRMQEVISSGTTDAPSWDLVRCAKLAARMYAPLGTEMSLGDYVRVVRTFLQAFKAVQPRSKEEPASALSEDESSVPLPESSAAARAEICRELKLYQDQLVKLGLKDDRLRHSLPPRLLIISRLLLRLVWAFTLLGLSLPGLILWLPIFLTTFIAVRNFKKTGPIWDTFDEIAQYKLIYGLFSGLTVWGGCSAFLAWKKGFVHGGMTSALVPVLMWLTLRWLEDGIAAFRASVALWQLLKADRNRVTELKKRRGTLYGRIMELAINELGLPDNPEAYFRDTEPGGTMGEKGRVKGRWQRGALYFSVRRRRKRDWNETLRLFDKVDYPDQ